MGIVTKIKYKTEVIIDSLLATFTKRDKCYVVTEVVYCNEEDCEDFEGYRVYLGCFPSKRQASKFIKKYGGGIFYIGESSYEEIRINGDDLNFLADSLWEESHYDE
ncbi:hypothetical protein CN984_12000 [Bacillus cereus]|uniref:Uncharacterized protein n=1 Tax=Bacillus cereus TaxID=1396 RepID=A0A2B9Q2Z2_BACCE|nr:hypothetical protein [Bacillus cereus]PEA25856.1 hypothetical protein CON44_18095 [Bacillus cereus]PGO29164.1 hypothetical protein CN984_12000 [Bacillus cereus]